MSKSMRKKLGMKPHGIFNAEKCADYLRYIGVEVSAEQEQSWKDTENVHRYLNKLSRKKVREGAGMMCRNEHLWYGEFRFRGRGMKANNEEAATCPECGLPYVSWRLRWAETLDGAVRDYRPVRERWRALDAPPQEGDLDSPLGL